MKEIHNSPLRAHLLRATHEWLTEGGHTPYLQVLVDAHVQVPPAYVQNGFIVLNISYDSTNRLQLGDDYISFQARFGGKVEDIWVPVSRVMSLFSKESQEGYAPMTPDEFVAIQDGLAPAPRPITGEGEHDPDPTPPEPARKKPSFKRVK